MKLLNPWFFLTLSCIASTASAGAAWKTTFGKKYGAAEFWACDSAMTSSFVYDFTPGFTGHQYSAFYDTMCQYPPSTGALLLCIHNVTGYNVDQMAKNFRFFASTCKQYTGYDQPWTHYREQYINATENIIDASEIANYSLPIYGPAYPDYNSSIGSYEGYRPFYRNIDYSTYYGAGLCVYFGVVMLIATFFNVLTKTGLIQKLSNPLVNYFRAYVTLPAMYPRGRHAQAWGGFYFITGLFPDRWDALVCFGFTIVHIVFWCIPYDAAESHAVLWGSKDSELQRYIGDRTGVLAFAEIPLLVLFAGRNNLLTFVTGIKYSSFIQYHKCVARFMFLDAMIHSVAYTYYCGGIPSAKYSADLKKLYFVCGVVATIFSGLLWLFSFHPIRRHLYEVFLYVHILFAIIFLVMCWYHCNTLGWCEWLIGSFAIWGLDRILRVLRMLTFGYQPAELEVFSADTFKVTVRKPKTFHSSPGQFGYVYFTDALLWFQNHPFTILNEGDRLVFYVKVKRGITKKIYNKLVANGGKLTSNVCVEGPYGERSAVGKYQNALLITGGAGVPGVISHALTLSQKQTPQNIKFVWIYRTFTELEPYLDDLLLKLKDTRVIIDVYLTRETSLEGIVTHDNEKNTSSSDNVSEKEKHRGFEDVSSFINFKIGRPDVEQLIPQEINAFGGGSVGIVACGPPPLMDQLKHTVSREVVSYKERIDYFDEFQIW